MFTNVNLEAPVGALAFLGTALTISLIVLLIGYSLYRRKFALTRVGLLAIAAIVVIYLFLLFTFSFKSSEQVLARGQEKHFCEIDCHLAYSITDVRETKTLGDAPNQLQAAGVFRVVTIKTRFDENTISRTRSNELLYPNSRDVSVMDEGGNKYLPSTGGQRVLEEKQAFGKPFTTPLRPGETYSTTLAFDLPPDIKNPTLLIREGELVTHFVIGHENSPLHKKTLFQI